MHRFFLLFLVLTACSKDKSTDCEYLPEHYDTYKFSGGKFVTSFGAQDSGSAGCNTFQKQDGECAGATIGEYCILNFDSLPDLECRVYYGDAPFLLSAGNRFDIIAPYQNIMIINNASYHEVYCCSVDSNLVLPGYPWRLYYSRKTGIVRMIMKGGADWQRVPG